LVIFRRILPIRGIDVRVDAYANALRPNVCHRSGARPTLTPTVASWGAEKSRPGRP